MGRATGFLGSDGNGLRPADDQPACNPRRRRSAAIVAKKKRSAVQPRFCVLTKHPA
jgi:hypothetical protein